jgi:hypothetical protein
MSIEYLDVRNARYEHSTHFNIEIMMELNGTTLETFLNKPETKYTRHRY